MDADDDVLDDQPDDQTDPIDALLDPDRRSWDRVPGESAKQYAWFQLYLNLPGADRSVRGAWFQTLSAEKQQTRGKSGAPRTWWVAYAKFDWKGRADDWDKHLRLLDERAFIQKRAEVRATRREALDLAFGKLMQRIAAAGEVPTVELLQSKDGKRKSGQELRVYPGLNVDDGRLVDQLERLAEQLRREYNDLPEVKTRNAAGEPMTVADQLAADYGDDDLPDDEQQLDDILRLTRSVRGSDVE